VADAAPVDLRGTAYGVFSLVSGVALLIASALAGLLWDTLGAAWTFYAGAAFSGLAAIALVVRPPSLDARLEARRRAASARASEVRGPAHDA
jgi:MFS family permease